MSRVLTLLWALGHAASLMAADAPRIYTNADLESVEGNLSIGLSREIPAPEMPESSPKPSAAVRKLKRSYQTLRFERDRIREALPDLEEAAARETDAFWVIRSGRTSNSARKRLTEAQERLEEVESELARIEERARKLGVTTVALMRE